MDAVLSGTRGFALVAARRRALLRGRGQTPRRRRTPSGTWLLLILARAPPSHAAWMRVGPGAVSRRLMLSSGGGRSLQMEVLAQSNQAAETRPTSLAACIFLSCFHVPLPPISLCLTLLLLLLLFPERISIFWKSKTESWH